MEYSRESLLLFKETLIANAAKPSAGTEEGGFFGGFGGAGEVEEETKEGTRVGVGKEASGETSTQVVVVFGGIFVTISLFRWCKENLVVLEWDAVGTRSTRNRKEKKESVVHRPSYELMLQAMTPTQSLLYQEQQV